MDVRLVELIDYLYVLRRRFVIMIVVLLACVGGAAGATALQTVTYKAHTQLIVNGASSTSAVDEITRRQLATERAVAFSQIATTAPALKAATIEANKVAGPFPPGGSLAVSATANGTDPFLTITVTGSNARQAQAVANAYLTILPVVLRKLDQAPPAVAEDLTTLQPAGLPRSPSSPRPVPNLLIGTAVGVALAILAAFVREALDRRLRDSDEVEDATKLPVLGVIPTELPKSRVPVITDPTSARAEAYRKVRTNLIFAGPDGVPKSLLITSAVSGEGKTTLAINLAMACARTGQRVALIDADLRRPMVDQYLDLPPNSRGLTNVLAGELTAQDALHAVDNGRVHVLTSGWIPRNPSELLGSMQMRDLMNPLLDAYDVVIIDAPPVLPVADALVLAVRVDAVVLVAKIGDTTRQRLLSARDAVLQVQGNLVGIVPNAVVPREDSAYAYAYRYKSHRRPDYLTSYSLSGRPAEMTVERIVPDGNYSGEPPPPSSTSNGHEHGVIPGVDRVVPHAPATEGEGPTVPPQKFVSDAGNPDRW